MTSSFPRKPGDYSGVFVAELGKRLTTRGFEVWVLCPDCPETRVTEQLDGLNVRRFRYWWPKTSQTLADEEATITQLRQHPLSLLKIPLFVLAEGLALWRLVRREKIQAINSHWLLPQGVVATAVARVTGCRHVATLHSTDVLLAAKLPVIGRWLARFVERFSGHVVIASVFVKARFERCLGRTSRATVMPMGVDLGRFRPVWSEPPTVPPPQPRLLFVGRLHPVKGVDVLLHAVPAILARFPDARVTVAGAGENRSAMETLREQLELPAERVHFLGAVPVQEMPELLRRHDALVVPSLQLPSGETEGFPVVILEALATGLPVVASRVGGIPEAIADGENGWLVDHGNPAALATGVERLMQDYPQLAAGALTSSRRFDWNRIADYYAELLQDQRS
ncbi:MAG: glycosyltransferase family 4 protein [bacterium]